MASMTQEGPLIPPRPTRITAAETPRAAMASPVVIAAVIIAGLYFGREILIPIAIALLLSFVLGPLVHFLRRIRFPRLVAVGLTVMLTMGVVAALATLIGVQVADLAGDVPRYRATIERKVEGLRESPVGRITEYVAGIGRAIHEAGAPDRSDKKAEKPAAEPGAEPEPKPVVVETRQPMPGPLETAEKLLSPALKPLATAGIVVVVLLFMLMQREDLRDRMIRLAGSSDLHRTTVAMDDAARRLSRYFVAQLALNAGFGVAIGFGLYMIGVPNPVLWGIFAALMRFVPYIGAFLCALFPMALAAAVDPGWNMLIATGLLFVVLEPLVGQIFEPMLYGHSTGLSPLAVLVSALFWTWLWGPIGLLLSTPLTVCLVVLGRHVDKLEFLDVLFGNTPALTPVENFYQRILADDPEEAQEHADLILAECSLSAYYDTVVVKGLELAARDAARGVLTVAQKSAIRESVTELIDELAERDDAAPEDAPPGSGNGVCDRENGVPFAPKPPTLPEAWTRSGAVLCVAGRGFLDEAAAAILAQLLAKRGLGTRVVPFSDLARAKIDTFEPGPARLVCIVSLAIAGEPTHLRRLARRLRQRLPEVPLIVGLWQADDVATAATAIPAETHVATLRGAVEAVVGMVREEAAPDRSARTLEPVEA